MLLGGRGDAGESSFMIAPVPELRLNSAGPMAAKGELALDHLDRPRARAPASPPQARRAPGR